MPDVRVVYEAANERSVDKKLLKQAVTQLEEVQDLDRVNVVLAGDFTNSVRRRLGAEEAAAFRRNRHTGMVGAKTISYQEEEWIIFPVELLQPGIARAAGIDVIRMFAHEGWHVALRAREEDIHSGFCRLQPASRSGALFVSQGFIVIEEARVERALCERGMPIEDSYLGELRDTLTSARDLFRDAAVPRYPGETLARSFETALPAFNDLTVRLSYLAADHIASDGTRTPSTSVRAADVWQRYVGPHWDELVQLIQTTPTAAIPWIPAKVDAAALRFAPMLRAWFKDVGFSVSDLPSNNYYFDILRHDF